LKTTNLNNIWRKTQQFLLPLTKKNAEAGKYDIYPSFKIEDKQIFEGFDSLASVIKKHKTIIIDGYGGNLFDFIQSQLNECLREQGLTPSWKKSSDYFKPESEIEEMISLFTGGNDPIFGTRTNLNLEDFFNLDQLKNLKHDPDADINLIIGPGAALSGWKGLIVYIDLPKNEIQFRSRAGSINNLGSSMPLNPKSMYKRFYFVDWVVLNKHKQTILPETDIIADGQRPENPTWIYGRCLRKCLSTMSRNVFRVRPWFEPGAWGGTWIKDHIEGLNGEVPNYEIGRAHV
jgi:hypothetical protein